MGGGIGSILYTTTFNTNKTEFFCYNAIGSTVALCDASGAVTCTTDYEAFGKEVRSTGESDNTRKFCTKERSESIGLDNFGFRYFDWELGRFTTRDPSGYPDGPNNYLYCHNNPINHIDPLGLRENTDSAAERTLGDKDVQSRLRKIGKINRSEARDQAKLTESYAKKLKKAKTEKQVEKLKKDFGERSDELAAKYNGMREKHEAFINERFAEYQDMQLADSGINFIEHGLINVGAFGLKNIFEAYGRETIHGEVVSDEDALYKYMAGGGELALWTLGGNAAVKGLGKLAKGLTTTNYSLARAQVQKLLAKGFTKQEAFAMLRQSLLYNNSLNASGYAGAFNSLFPRTIQLSRAGIRAIPLLPTQMALYTVAYHEAFHRGLNSLGMSGGGTGNKIVEEIGAYGYGLVRGAMRYMGM